MSTCQLEWVWDTQKGTTVEGMVAGTQDPEAGSPRYSGGKLQFGLSQWYHRTVLRIATQ